MIHSLMPCGLMNKRFRSTLSRQESYLERVKNGISCWNESRYQAEMKIMTTITSVSYLNCNDFVINIVLFVIILQ